MKTIQANQTVTIPDGGKNITRLCKIVVIVTCDES